jgi:tetratricopeptide (TPR) repeat protein
MKFSRRILNSINFKTNMPGFTRKHFVAMICLVLAVGTFAVYWPVTHHEFVNYDDPAYITGNPHVTSGLTLTNVVWAFKSGESANWHPLTWISHMIDCNLYGTNPGGHHLTSLLFHITNTLLLFLLLNELTGALWRSFFVAAFFAWHPLHVESVAWAAERKDVLSAFFWMLTLMAYTKYVKSAKNHVTSIPYCIALFFFACGLMSKPMVVTLPFVLLLLDFWPLKRMANGEWRIQNFKNLLVEKTPFFALAIASSVITCFAQRGAMWSASSLPLQFRLENALMSYARYIFKIFWPTDLALIYPYPHHWPVELVAGAALMLAVWSGLFILRARQNPYLIVGWLWFLGTLVPVIGIVQTGVQSMADRYTYIPSIGLFIVVVWGVGDLLELRPEWKKFLPMAGSVALAGCLAVTSIQLNYWQDSMKLFSHAIAVTTGNYAAYNCLGNVLEQDGEKEKAFALYAESVRVEPDYPLGQFNLGMMLLEYGRPDEGFAHLTIAANLMPRDPTLQYDLGIFLSQHGRPDEAAVHFANALKDKPDFAGAQRQLDLLSAKTNAPPNRSTP